MIAAAITIGGRPDAPQDEEAPEGPLSALWIRVALDAVLIFAAGYVLSQTDDAIATQADFEVVSTLLGTMMIGVFMVGLLERRDRTIVRMGLDSAAVIVLFGLGAGLLASI